MEQGRQLTPYRVWDAKKNIKGFLWYSETTDEVFIMDYIGRGERRIENIDGLMDREEVAMEAYRAQKHKYQIITTDGVTIYFVAQGLIGQSIIAALNEDKENQVQRLQKHYNDYKISAIKKYHYLSLQLEIAHEAKNVIAEEGKESDSGTRPLYYIVLRKCLPENVKVSDHLSQIAQETRLIVNNEIRQNHKIGKYDPEILGQIYLATGRFLLRKEAPDWSFILSKNYSKELPFFINYDKSTFYTYLIGYIYWTAFVEDTQPMEILKRSVSMKQACKPKERNFAREEDFVYLKYHACMTFMIRKLRYLKVLTHADVLERLQEEHQMAQKAFKEQHLPTDIAEGREDILYLADDLDEYLSSHKEQILYVIHMRLSEVYSKLRRMDMPQIEKKRRIEREKEELTIPDSILNTLRPYREKSAKEFCQKLWEIDGQDGFNISKWSASRLFKKLSRELDIHHYQCRNFEIYLKQTNH